MAENQSTENLVSSSESNISTSRSSMNNNPQKRYSLAPEPDRPLTSLEKRFLLYVERGDCASVRRHIEINQNNPEFDINCVDPLNRSALIAAIENENAELVHILLECKIQVKDALLHAIKEEYVEAVEVLLEYEEHTHVSGQPYSWEAVDRAQATFTPDITPLTLAAHMNNYEIIKLLLDRGATLPTPHDVRCGCDTCVSSSEEDSLRYSQARINAYRALSSPSLIALSSRDPLLTAFELSWELRRLSRMENEFRHEYNEMREQVQNFATSLLDHTRTSAELDTILNYDPDGDNSDTSCSLERLKLAIKYKQKNFVAHPNVQQLLGFMWYDGLPGFRRKGIIAQVMGVAKIGMMFPFYSMIYMIAPTSKTSQFMAKPFVKFISHSSSYAFFLLLLGAASQRVEFLVLEWFGNDWMQDLLKDWKRRERGSLPGIFECGVIIYVISLIQWEIRTLWKDGLLEYVGDLWNMVDYCCNLCYITWVGLRAIAVFITWREYWNGWDPYYPREQWDPFDPMLLSEGMFAAGMILSYLKLVHIFSVNRHMGPLQISLGRMMIDILKFFFIYMLVLFAFGCGTNQLLWYYADLEKQKCYHKPDGSADFDNAEMACTIWRRFSNMFETSQSLFWASFGLVDLMAFELTGIKSFTRFWALLMFGSYSVINIIVLLNMLIAMMSNSYQIISERSDVEWKFARSKLWMSYFEEGEVVPPPFNLVPGMKLISDPCGKRGMKSGSVKLRIRKRALERHDTVARLIVRRFVTAEQRKRDDYGITEDDVMEIRQDISTLRFELVDILRNNGMKTPTIDNTNNAVSGKKGKVLERRLMKDFQIGCIEGIVTEALSSREPKDVFSKIAQAIGMKSNKKESKKDWNAHVAKSLKRKDPIGSSTESQKRRLSRQSLRRYIIENENANMAKIDSNKIVEYNPKLEDMTPATRVAYAKFKTGKIKKEYKFHEDIAHHALKEEENDNVLVSDDETDGKHSMKNKTLKLADSLQKSHSSAGSEKELNFKFESDGTYDINKESAPPTQKVNKIECTLIPQSATPPLKPSGEPCTIEATDSKSRKPSISEGKMSLAPQVPPRNLQSPTPSTLASNSKDTKIQYSSDLEPGKGKSKVTGNMTQGWI